MKKDKKWLKNEMFQLKVETDAKNEYGSNYTDEQLAIKRVFTLIDQLDEPEITEEQAWEKIAESFPVSSAEVREGITRLVLSNPIDLSEWEKLSKPTLPVIPHFVAEWIERNKQPDYDYDSKEDALADSIHFTLYSLEANYPETNSDVILRKPVNEWLDNDRKNYWKLIDAVRYGYEVEKEKLYWIVMPTGHIAYRCGDGISYVTEHYKESSDSEKFTEAEIKAIDERLWSFAEEITE